MPINKQITSIITFFILFLLVIAIAVFTLIKNSDESGFDLKSFSDKLLKGNKTIKTTISKEVPLDNNENGSFTKYKGYLVRCVSNRITFYDNVGKEVWSHEIISSKPFLRVDKNWLLCGDFDGKWVYALHGKEIKWSKELDGNTIAGDINQDGYVVVISAREGSKGVVSILNLQGIVYLTKVIAKNYITLAKMMPNSSDYFLCRLSTDKLSVDSTLEFFNMENENSYKSINLGNKMYFNVNILDGGRFLFVGDSSVLLIGFEKKIDFRKNYKQILSLKQINGSQVVLSVLKESQNSIGNLVQDILILDKYGKEKSIYKTDEKIIGVDTSNSSILVNEGRSVELLNFDGSMVSNYISQNAVTAAYMIDENHAALVTDKKLVFLKF